MYGERNLFLTDGVPMLVPTLYLAGLVRHYPPVQLLILASKLYRDVDVSNQRKGTNPEANKTVHCRLGSAGGRGRCHVAKGSYVLVISRFMRLKILKLRLIKLTRHLSMSCQNQ